jgi:hypothetical protein
VTETQLNTTVLELRERKKYLRLIGFFLAIPLMWRYFFGQGIFEFYAIPVGAVGCTLFGIRFYLRSKRICDRVRSDQLFKLLRIFVIVSAISVAIGLIRYQNLGGLRSFAFQLLLLCFCMLGLLLLRGNEEIVAFLKAIVITTALSCFLIVGFLIRTDSFPNLFAMHNDASLMATIFGWPNGYGCFLAVALVFTLDLFSSVTRRAAKCFYGGSVAILSVGILLTLSRSAYVTATLGILFWAVKTPGKLKKILVFVFMSCILLYALTLFPEIPGLVTNLDTGEERLAFSQMLLEDSSLSQIVVGHGYQNIEVYTRERAGESIIPGLAFETMSTHNEYLTMFLKAGGIGFVVFAWILFLIVKRAYKISSRSGNVLTRRIFGIWLCALIPLLVSMLVQENLRYWPIAVVFWMLAGSSMNFQPISSTTASDARNRVRVNVTSS